MKVKSCFDCKNLLNLLGWGVTEITTLLLQK